MSDPLTPSPQTRGGGDDYRTTVEDRRISSQDRRQAKSDRRKANPPPVRIGDLLQAFVVICSAVVGVYNVGEYTREILSQLRANQQAQLEDAHRITELVGRLVVRPARPLDDAVPPMHPTPP